MDIEKRARGLLAATYKARGELLSAYNIERGELHSLYSAEIAAVCAALTPPEGYVLVPVKATEAMRKAFTGYRPVTDASFAARYAAMIAARPEVP